MDFRILATCEPYLPGYGFRAALESDGRVYRIVSWDPRERVTPAHFNGPGDSDFAGPTIRAEVCCADVRLGASGGDDRHVAELVAAFMAAYVERPEEFDRDPEDMEQAADNRDWWSRWGDQLTGTEDDGTPLNWNLPPET